MAFGGSGGGDGGDGGNGGDGGDGGDGGEGGGGGADLIQATHTAYPGSGVHIPQSGWHLFT